MSDSMIIWVFEYVHWEAYNVDSDTSNIHNTIIALLAVTNPSAYDRVNTEKFCKMSDHLQGLCHGPSTVQTLNLYI